MQAAPARVSTAHKAPSRPVRGSVRTPSPLASIVRPLVTAPPTPSHKPPPRTLGFELAKVAIEAPHTHGELDRVHDPATLIEEGRRTPSVALPHRAAASRLFGVPLDGVEVHTGDRAARVCRALGASALAVRNVILFANDAPSLWLVVHEVAHVLQQDGLGDRAPRRFAAGSLRTSERDEPAEREAFAAAHAPSRTMKTRPHLRRAAVAVYRASPQESVDDKADPAKSGTPEAEKIVIPVQFTAIAAKRLWVFSRYSSFAPGNQTVARFGLRTEAEPPTFEEIKQTSPAPWYPRDYKAFMASDQGKQCLARAEIEVTPEAAVNDVSRELKKHAKLLMIARVRRSPKSPTAKVDTGPYACLDRDVDTVFDLQNPEARLTQFTKDANYAITRTENPKYGRKKTPEDPDNAVEKWIVRYPEGSKNTFDTADYQAVLSGISAPPSATAPADPSAVEPPDETPKDALGDLPFLSESGLGDAFGLAKVGLSKDARTYAIVRGAKPHYWLVQLTDKKAQRTPAELISDYRKILKAIPKVASETLPTHKDATAPPDRTPTKEDARHARHRLMDLVVEKYTDKDEAAFFSDVIQGVNGDPFGNTYARIKGNIFEAWVFQWRFQGKPVTLDKTQPYFLWKEVSPVSQRMKRRFGDGRLIGAKGDNVILEAKAYTASTIPTLGNEKNEDQAATKDDDLVLQMKDYNTIIKTPVPAWAATPVVIQVEDILDTELEEKPKQKSSAQAPQKEIVFQYALYEFGDVSVADKWKTALRKTLPSLYATDPQIPGDAASQAVRLQIGFNPNLPIQLPKGDGLEHKITTFPGFRQPGVVLKEANIKLALPGKPLLAAGSTLLMDVDMKGLKQEGVTKSIEPVVGKSTPPPKPGAPEPPLHGRAENKFSGLKSALDKFLQRVQTDAHLVKDGVAAEIAITDGPSGIPGLDLVGTKLTASYTLSKKLVVEGQVGLQRPDKKISGKVGVKYEQDEWTYKGECEVKDLIAGLDPFQVNALVRGEDKRLWTDKVALRRTLGAVTLTGQLTAVKYDLTKAAFSAAVHLDAEIPAFGKVGADGTVADNQLERLTFSYASKPLAYGPKGKPIISGSLSGSATFDKGEFTDAKIGGTANLKIPALEKIAKSLGDLGFVVDATITAQGKVSGSITTASDKPIELGKYFRIPLLRVDLLEDGNISSRFALEVVNIQYLKEGRVECQVSASGFKVLSASAKAKIGDETKDRVAAELGLSYDSGTSAFIVSGMLWLRIKEGMVAKGSFTWNSATNTIHAKLGIDRITLLAFAGEKTFLKVKKQIPLVSIYGLGIYLDARFVLAFKYGFNLGITPSVQLQGLNLDDFTFALAIATVKLDGLLEATLLGTPGVGLGLFVLSPSLLRGGGGIKVPVAATAKAKPEGTVEIRYKPNGSVEGGSRIGITLSFGIKGQIKPYAELSVLDGVYEPTWEGDSLHDFTIMEERELFTYFIDFGATLTKEENPTLPEGEKGKSVPPRGSDEKQRFGTKREGDKAEDPPKGLRNATPSGPKSDKEDGSKTGGGFDLQGMSDKLLTQPKFAPIKKVLDAASDAWNAISGAIGKVVDFFKKWFDVLAEGVNALVEAIRTIAKEGVLAYFKKLLKRKLGALYDIIAPIFDALENLAGKFDERLEKLLHEPIPTTPIAFLEWTITALADVLSIAIGGITDLAAAVAKVFENAVSAGGRFVNYLVKQGRIGVRRHVYYIPGIPAIKDPVYFYAPTEYKANIWGFKREEKIDGDLIGIEDVLDPLRVVEKAIAFGLWIALHALPEVETTNDTPDDSDVSGRRNNYWA